MLINKPPRASCIEIKGIEKLEKEVKKIKSLLTNAINTYTFDKVIKALDHLNTQAKNEEELIIGDIKNLKDYLLTRESLSGF